MSEMILTEHNIEFFKRRVEKRGVDDCWLWKTKSIARYGSATANGKRVYATHIALFLDGRPQLQHDYALHTCDNKRCVNPRHLYWGSQKQNIFDAVRRGKGPPGYRRALHGTELKISKLSKLKVQAIRRFRRAGCSYREIAQEFAISQTTARNIIIGKTWAHVKPAVILIESKDDERRKLTEAKVKKIRACTTSCWTLAAKYGVSAMAIVRARKRKTWIWVK